MKTIDIWTVFTDYSSVNGDLLWALWQYMSTKMGSVHVLIKGFNNLSKQWKGFRGSSVGLFDTNNFGCQIEGSEEYVQLLGTVLSEIYHQFLPKWKLSKQYTDWRTRKCEKKKTVDELNYLANPKVTGHVFHSDSRNQARSCFMILMLHRSLEEFNYCSWNESRKCIVKEN